MAGDARTSFDLPDRVLFAAVTIPPLDPAAREAFSWDDVVWFASIEIPPPRIAGEEA